MIGDDNSYAKLLYEWVLKARETATNRVIVITSERLENAFDAKREEIDHSPGTRSLVVTTETFAPRWLQASAWFNYKTFTYFA